MEFKNFSTEEIKLSTISLSPEVIHLIENRL